MVFVVDQKNVSVTVKHPTNATIRWYFGRMMANVIRYTQEVHVKKVSVNGLQLNLNMKSTQALHSNFQESF